MSTVVAIGNFDGVHLGHQRVLREAMQSHGDPLVVITFWPHPMSVLRPDKAPKLLGDLHSRIDLLKAAGAREVRVVNFTEAVAQLSPREFVERFVLPLEPSRVVVGENFRFGHRAAGDVAELARLGQGHFEVVHLALESINDIVTCSTLIRTSLADGDVAGAAEHLGRPFRVRGVVVMGDQRGRELGYPTANLPVPSDMAVPADGVYAGWLSATDGLRLPAAISVGSNPTFNGVDRRVETYVLDRTDLELYGEEIVVDFVDRLRGQVKFDGIEGLISQMDQDISHCRVVLGLDG
ncbi:bifunctional riboflavin kinase/FAD synthetase [Tessaracoccus antarcticus]|uniref:Riboflavin biosynthesis protein n=1 Tax=Tessaracoccus antarcticus TaxID=2479848 RepID=A0A3M0GDV4_9ACTN|nr:bifunctional riboflavin kinase/FAD synthetase [Tessaracoccus antarcticus]RMB59783.1 bifunctional riboflavin kinase/FAD synthetase [Tessaracoccus antarcticus]